MRMHWDFALILIFLAVAVPFFGRRRVQKLMRLTSTTKGQRLKLYLSTSLSQWVATSAILWRCRTHGIAFTDLALAAPKPILTLIVSLALTALIIVNQVFSLRHLTAESKDGQPILFHLATKVFPQDDNERLAFLGLVVSVAFCEEVIYRGFVQKVFQDWSGGSVAAAVVGSALLFGVAHLYQGRRGLISTSVIGLIFSSIRAGVGSLVPVMAAHFTADLMAGFLTPAKVRALQIPNEESQFL